MRKLMFGTATHGVALAVGFALGVYFLPVLIAPEEMVDVAFVADNPGDWALHCHVLEHAAAGMMGYVRVS